MYYINKKKEKGDYYKRTIVKKFTFEDFLEELEEDALDLFADEDYAYDYEFVDAGVDLSEFTKSFAV